MTGRRPTRRQISQAMQFYSAMAGQPPPENKHGAKAGDQDAAGISKRGSKNTTAAADSPQLALDERRRLAMTRAKFGRLFGRSKTEQLRRALWAWLQRTERKTRMR